MHYFIHADCIDHMSSMPENSIDVVVTSPPYNLNKSYSSYEDNKPWQQYCDWTEQYALQIKRLLKPDGSFFLNIGSTCKNPWLESDIANIMRKIFVLQNKIIWIKSISIGKDSHGHFKPVNSKRFVTHTNESIFHFTLDGKREIDKLAVGVPYKDKSNIDRWQSNNSNDLRCSGNSWFIPYETIQKKSDKGDHPAVFPVELPKRCIKLHGSCKLVLDPFGGTGSTSVACKQLGIDSVYIDMDKEYLKLARERVAAVEES